jgi:hypothetical protein
MLVALKLTTGPVPVPVRVMTRGLPGALSEMVIVPVRAPGAVGVNVTFMAQLAPAATELPQVLVSAKSPLDMMPVMLRRPLPLLVSVTA